MKTIIAVILLLALCLIANSQPAMVGGSPGNFQGVGGDFGKTWINNYLSKNPRPIPQADNNTNLWGWGTMPKGKALEKGKLVDSPNGTYYYDSNANYLGEYYVDPYTSQPIYENYPSYLIPVYQGSIFYDPNATSPAKQFPLPVFLQNSYPYNSNPLVYTIG